MKPASILLVALVVGVLIVSGCTSSRVYNQPDLVENPPVKEITPVQEQPPLTESPQEPEPVQTFGVGDTATDGKLAVTLNGMRTTRVMGGQYTTQVAPDGEEYIIVDITVENTQKDKTASFSPLYQTNLADIEGFTYDPDIFTIGLLSKDFPSGDILPGRKVRGEIPFIVPEDAELELLVSTDLFGGSTVVFSLSQ